MFRTCSSRHDHDWHRQLQQSGHTTTPRGNVRDWYAGPMHRSMLEPSTTSCEGNNSSDDNPSRPPPYRNALHGEISPDNPYKEQIEEMRQELEEPCKACMYTGVSVCLGLSLYFVKLATDDTTLRKNRRFLWMCSAGSVAAGAYRWYLD